MDETSRFDIANLYSLSHSYINIFLKKTKNNSYYILFCVYIISLLRQSSSVLALADKTSLVKCIVMYVFVFDKFYSFWYWPAMKARRTCFISFKKLLFSVLTKRKRYTKFVCILSLLSWNCKFSQLEHSQSYCSRHFRAS